MVKFAVFFLFTACVAASVNGYHTGHYTGEAIIDPAFLSLISASHPGGHASAAHMDPMVLQQLIQSLSKPPSPSPSPPKHSSSCGCKKCKPERVRIVVVDDCKDKSKSCSEESHEIKVPAKGCRTLKYKLTNKRH